MSTKTKTTLSNIISDPRTFVSKRLPNFWEAVTTSSSQATMDTFTGRVKSFFGDNPTASAIFRDIAKIPSIFANVYQNNSLGFTDTKYDEGSLWSHGVKVGCKATILVGHQFTYFTKYLEFETVARSANYICEAPNRFLSIATREKQKIEKLNFDEPKKLFWDFIWNNSKTSWYYEAPVEAIAKTAISDQLGEGVKRIGYIEYIRNGATIIDNIILTLFGNPNGVSFESKDDIYAKVFKIFAAYGVDYRTPIVISLTTAVDWTSKFATEMINAYTLGTPTRACQDFTGAVTAEIYSKASNVAEDGWGFNNVTSYVNNLYDTYITGELKGFNSEL